MKLKIKQVIFTDKTKDWKPLERNWKWFFMFHIQLEDWKWMSKFYSRKEYDPSSKIKVWEEYDILYKVNWDYLNLVSILDLNWNIIL